MIIKTAKFVKSSSSFALCPVASMPEYSFIGRSNVGKSSLINMLTGNKKLAKISGKPGKTQLINHFLINDKWYLVDLPGYGYAKSSKMNRYIWNSFTDKYLKQRENLLNLFILIDCRIKPQSIDLAFMEDMGENSIPFSIVFTKADKISKGKLSKNIQIYKNEMLKNWEEMPNYFISSVVSMAGKSEILNLITEINKNTVFENKKKPKRF